MITHDCEHGTPEWFAARCGVITASMFTVARKYTGLDERQHAYVSARRKGANTKDAANAAGYKSAPRSEKIDRALRGEDVKEYSEAAKNYAFTLACERLTGKVMSRSGYSPWEAARGLALEAEAREAHSFVIDSEITDAGFTTTDDGRFGCTPDGFFAPNGGAEIKSFIAPDKVRSIVFDADIGDVKDQVMGSLWITGRDEWHMVLYYPDLASIGRDLYVHKFERDQPYIDALVADLESFDSLVQEYMVRINNASTIRSFS